MRYFEFKKGVNDDDYEILYDGIVASSKPFGLDSEGRVIGQVLDRLEALGSPATRGDRATFALSKDGVLEINEVELTLIIETLKTVPWLAKAVRRALRTIDMLSSLPTTDPRITRAVKVG